MMPADVTKYATIRCLILCLFKRWACCFGVCLLALHILRTVLEEAVAGCTILSILFGAAFGHICFRCLR